jgi:hypothetical protein
MVETLHAGREKTENDLMIIGDDINEIVAYCLPKIIPKSRPFYKRELQSDLENGHRSMIDVHAGMGTFYSVIYIDPKIISITLKV